MFLVDNLNYSPPRLDYCVCVNADVVIATAVFTDITGLTASLRAGKKYTFTCHLFHISAATTTGIWFAANMPVAPTTLIMGNYSGVTNSVTAGAVAIGTATVRDTAITAQTTGSAGITHTILAGFVEPSATGVFAIRARPEVAANVTIKKGSFLIVREAEN